LKFLPHPVLVFHVINEKKKSTQKMKLTRKANGFKKSWGGLTIKAFPSPLKKTKNDKRQKKTP